MTPEKFDYITGEKFMKISDICIYNKNILIEFPILNKYIKYLILCDNNITDDNIIKIKSSKIFFCKSDHLNFFETRVMPHIVNKFILISHNSDYTVGKHSNIINNKLLIKWYGMNMTPNEKTYGIPIGLENTMWYRTNFETLKQNENNIKNNLLFFNFNVNTNLKERQKIKKIIENKGFQWNNNQNWNKYIETLSTYSFCISPEGNGVDCHRIWEALYVNCIPIVKNNDILKNYFADLPILWIDDYNIITENYLKEKLNDFKNLNNLKRDKINFIYWKNKIFNDLNE